VVNIIVASRTLNEELVLAWSAPYPQQPNWFSSRQARLFSSPRLHPVKKCAARCQSLSIHRSEDLHSPIKKSFFFFSSSSVTSPSA